MIRALPRLRTAAPRPTLADRLATLLASLRPHARADTRPHYSGEFGDTASGLTPYDAMSAAEHDAAGALWAEMARGDE